MTRHLGLRTRLTILVTGVFALAIVVTSVVVIRTVERDLVADTEASAQRVLTNYLDGIYGGTATVGVLDSAASSRFFYLDADGKELTLREYFEAIAVGFDAPFFENDAGVFVEPTEGVMVESGIDIFGPEVIAGAVEIDPSTGVVVDAAGSTVSFVVGPRPVGEAQPVDLGPGVIGVAQTLEFADGTTLQVGVSSPLQPVTDSLDTIRRILWFGVPLVVAAIAMATWLAASRALAPVHAITRRAGEIRAENISERVPVGAGNDEIQELARTMNDMLARLEDAQTRQRRLVADVSHELRSPVAASRAQLEVAQAAADPDWAATAATVLSEQEHLSRLIDDLLALSRLEEAGPTACDEVDLDEVVVEEAGRVHGLAVCAAVHTPVRVPVDRTLIVRAIRNLVENAARHAVSRVEVSLDRDGSVAVIHVDDDGGGVPVGDRERIFERFDRLDESRTRSSGGAGLGLAIVDGVVRAHHGTVSVGDSPLGGARFSLELPLGD